MDFVSMIPWHSLSGPWIYWVVFLASLLEASPIFWMFIPGQTILVLSGFIAKTGSVGIVCIIAVASIGAILWDLIGYSIGRFYGAEFIDRYGKYVLFERKHFDKTKKIMKWHAGKTLITGRFIFITRSFAPFVAGASHVSFPRFIFFNITWGILWSLAFSLVWFVFWNGYLLVSKYTEKTLFMLLALAVLTLMAYRFAKAKKE